MLKSIIRKGLAFGIVFLMVFVAFVGMPMNVSAEKEEKKNWLADGNYVGTNDKLGSLNNEDLRIITNGIQRMVVTADGKVGIGITSPSEKLDVLGNIHASDSFKAGTGTTYGDGNIDLAISTNLNIDSGTLYVDNENNRVGIGTTSPGTMLEVNGVITASGGTSTEWNTAYGWGDHALAGYIKSYTETDPFFSAWDKSTGISITESQITDLNHFTNADETDPQVGANTLNYVPKWDGSALVTGTIYDNGNVGIGTTSPGAKTHIVQIGTTYAFRVDDQTGDTTPFVIDQNGNVGIGTISPTEKLDVDGNIHASGTITSGSSITIDGTTDKITASSGKIDFDNENLVTTGKIGIGTTSPWANLHIAGSVGATFKLQDTRTNGGTLTLKAGSNHGHIFVEGANPLVLGNNNIGRINIASNGNVGIWASTPDYQLTIGDGTNNKIHFSGSTSPGNPSSGSVVIYFDGTDLIAKNSSGTTKTIADF